MSYKEYLKLKIKHSIRHAEYLLKRDSKIKLEKRIKKLNKIK